MFIEDAPTSPKSSQLSDTRIRSSSSCPSIATTTFEWVQLTLSPPPSLRRSFKLFFVGPELIIVHLPPSIELLPPPLDHKPSILLPRTLPSASSHPRSRDPSSRRQASQLPLRRVGWIRNSLRLWTCSGESPLGFSRRVSVQILKLRTRV